jgi:hypothetical protein
MDRLPLWFRRRDRPVDRRNFIGKPSRYIAKPCGCGMVTRRGLLGRGS